jgi:hypothetical protein
MKYLVPSIAGILGLAAGWIIAVAVLIGFSAVLGVADREGGLAMMAFFGVGPFAGLIGLIAGVWLALRRYNRRGLAALAAHVAVTLLIVAALAAATAGAFWINRPYVASNALPPSLMFEIKLPRGTSAPALVSQAEAYARRSPIELQTSENTMSAEIDAVREEDGRSVVSGRVEMYYRTRERFLVLKQSSGDVVFEIKLGATPEHSDQFSGWQPPIPIEGQLLGTGENGYQIRYRAAWEEQY